MYSSQLVLLMENVDSNVAMNKIIIEQVNINAITRKNRIIGNKINIAITLVLAI